MVRRYWVRYSTSHQAVPHLPLDGAGPLDPQSWQIQSNQEQKEWLGVSLLCLSLRWSSDLVFQRLWSSDRQQQLHEYCERPRQRHSTAPSRVGTSNSNSENSQKKPQWRLHSGISSRSALKRSKCFKWPDYNWAKGKSDFNAAEHFKKIIRPKYKMYVFELHIKCPCIWITPYNIN